jgi:hypothetical protein
VFVSGVWRLRAAILFLAGGLLLHQVRYAIAPADLVREFAPAHKYLWWLIPVVGTLLFVATTHWAARLRTPDRDRLPQLPSVRVLWAMVTAGLVVAFGAQEFVESLIFRDQVLTWAELAGGNGWVVLPLAVAVGGVVAVLLKGAVKAQRWALGRHVPSASGRGSLPAVRPSAVVLVPRASVLARELAGRAPPVRA